MLRILAAMLQLDLLLINPFAKRYLRSLCISLARLIRVRQALKSCAYIQTADRLARCGSDDCPRSRSSSSFLSLRPRHHFTSTSTPFDKQPLHYSHTLVHPRTPFHLSHQTPTPPRPPHSASSLLHHARTPLAPTQRWTHLTRTSTLRHPLPPLNMFRLILTSRFPPFPFPSRPTPTFTANSSGTVIVGRRDSRGTINREG